MDHSYRAVLQDHDGNTHMPDRRGGKPFPVEAAPQPVAADAPTRIYAFVDDLFFLAKITETARKLGVKVEFVKTEKDVFERMGQNGNAKVLRDLTWEKQYAKVSDLYKTLVR